MNRDDRYIKKLDFTFDRVDKRDGFINWVRSYGKKAYTFDTEEKRCSKYIVSYYYYTKDEKLDLLRQYDDYRLFKEELKRRIVWLITLLLRKNH